MTSGLSEACPTSWSTPYLTVNLIGLIDKKEKQKKDKKSKANGSDHIEWQQLECCT